MRQPRVRLPAAVPGPPPRGAGVRPVFPAGRFTINMYNQSTKRLNKNVSNVIPRQSEWQNPA